MMNPHINIRTPLYPSPKEYQEYQGKTTNQLHRMTENNGSGENLTKGQRKDGDFCRPT
jgi:hypothetical protein